MSTSSRAKGHPVRGAISGVLTGFFGGIMLWLLGVLDSDSIVIVALPVLVGVLGWVLGVVAPIKRAPKGDDTGPEKVESGASTGDVATGGNATPEA